MSEPALYLIPVEEICWKIGRVYSDTIVGQIMLERSARVSGALVEPAPIELDDDPTLDRTETEIGL